MLNLIFADVETITYITLLIVLVGLPAIVIPLTVILGYKHTHSEKYIETHKEQIEANKRKREERQREFEERIRRQNENVASGAPSGRRTHLERMGNRGETSINNLIMNEVINNGWYLVKNVIISNKANHSSQIDHVVINNSGIYVIETKNLIGSLSGNPNEKYLKRRYRGSRREYSFYNPLIQNKAHAKALSIYLKDAGVEMDITPLSVVLGASIRGELTSYIYNPITLLSTLKESSLNRKYDDEQVKNAFKILEFCCNNPSVTQKEHIERVREIHPKRRHRR